MNAELSHYQIIKTISENNDHMVSLARNELDGEQVVIKKINGLANTNRASILFRLKREAQILQDFCSDFVVKLLDIIENEQAVYLIMEYCQGNNLRQACFNMPLEGKIEAFLSAAEALESIHQKEIVHRDLKPDNILVLSQPGMHLKIIDFGLAYIKNLTDVFREGTVVGTLAYLSPEQTGLLRRPLDNRTDLYSLGATFYEVFSGQLPFTEKDPLKLIHAHLSCRPQVPSRLNEEIPPMLDKILLKLLEKEPSERYQQALGLKNDLYRLLENPLKTFEVALAGKENRVEYNIKAVGRDKEIQALRGLYGKSLAGQFTVQIIQGKSGIGKSKIMEAFKESLDFASTLLFQSQCSLDTKNVPFRIFREFFSFFFQQPAGHELINSLAGKFEKDLVLFQALLPDCFTAKNQNSPVNSEQPREKQRFFQAIKQFLLELGTIKKSFVWCVEDFQWADLASQELLSYLSKNLVGMPFYFLCTQRVEEQNEHYLEQNPQFHVLKLQELPYKSLPVLVSHILGQKVEWDEEFYEKIYQDSLGNTFYMIELIKALIQEKVLVWEKGSWVLKNKLFRQYEFKTDMTQLIFARLSGFSFEEKDVLTSASILGKEFNLDVLQKILEKERKTFSLSQLFTLMEKAKKEQILEENFFKSGNSYAFAHDKILESLQKILSEAELQAKHELCASVLEGRESVSGVYQLAYHYNFTSNRSKKIHYNELAARQALSQYSLVEAVYYMEKVTSEYYPVGPSLKKAQIEFMLRTANLMQQAGFLDKSRELVVGLMENLDEKNLAFIKLEALILLGSFHYFKNQLPLALKYYQEAMEEGKKTGQQIKYWRPYYLVGNTYFYKSEYNLSVSYFSKALELIPKEEKDDLQMILALRLYSYYFLGRISDGVQDQQDLEKNLAQIDNPIVLSHIYHSLALCLNWQGQHAKGLEYSLKASALGERAGYAIAVYAAHFSRMLSYFFTEDYEKLSETLLQVMELAQKNKILLIIEVFRALGAFGLLLDKKYQELENVLDEFLPLAQQMDNKFAHVVFLYLRSALYYTQNKLEDSLSYITEALKLSGERELDITSPWLLLFYQELLKIKEPHSSPLEIQEQIKSLLEKKPGLVYMFEHAQKVTLFLKAQRLEILALHQTLSSTSVFKEKLQLENIVKTSQMISSILDTEILLDSILQSMLETTGAQRGVLKLNQLQNYGESFILKNITKEEEDFSFILNLLSKSQKKKNGQVLSEKELGSKGIFSAIYNPLIIKGNIIGVVYLDSKVIKDLFSEEELKLLNIFTAQAAIAIENARTFEDLKQERNSLEVKVRERTRELSNKNRIIEQRNRQFMDELKLAQIIQEGLIPSKPPEITGIRLASLYKPMEDVGGDFFDFIKVREPYLLGIFISDVSGHGVPAALITSMVKTLVETAGEKRVRPQELLGYMNDKLTGQTGGNFLTAFYGVYDTRSRILTYARGAHNTPFLMRGTEIITLESRGKMLGLLENLEFEEKEIELHPGDKLLFYTDGLTEAANAQGLEFEEIMPKILQELKTLPASEFLDQLYHALLNHREDFLFEDDVCVVVMDVE